MSTLATAQASKRAREIGVRKVLGSSRKAVIQQFFYETLILTCIAAIHSYAFTGIILNQLNKTLTTIHFDVQMPATLIWYVALIVLLIAVSASIYPAISMSGYDPVKALKSKISGNSTRDRWLRNTLVFMQFSIVQLLIIGTIVVHYQMDYFRTKDLGYDTSAIVITNVPDPDIDLLKSYKQQLLQHPNIEKVSFSSGIPTEPTFQYGTFFRLGHESEDFNREAEMKVVDLAYKDMYNLDLVAGNWLSELNVNDHSFNGFVVNESLVDMLNMEIDEIIGEEIQINEGKAKVIGVVRDFHNQALHESVTPCILFYWGTGFLSEAGIKMSSMVNTKGTLDYVAATWKENFPITSTIGNLSMTIWQEVMKWKKNCF